MVEASLRARFETARDAALSSGRVPTGEGRGIVICAGGARLYTCAWVCIGLLRRTLGCTLPIQLWHLGPEELGPPMRDMISRFDVEVIDAFEMARLQPAARLAGWELKPYALSHCRFREVLLLDADNVPIVDPAGLFDTPAYLETGALFWPDVVRLLKDNPVWDATGVEPWRGPSLESGQLVVDKARCGPALELTHWMNQNAGEFYEMIWGDKDTFLLSWLATGTPFSLIPHPPDQLEGILCQKGADGEVLFQHRTNCKWTLLGRAAAIEGFRLQAESVALLAELAREWDGWIFNPPQRSVAARTMEAQLVRQKAFVLTRVSMDQKPVQLGACHRIVSGAAPDLVYWHVEDGLTGVELVLETGSFVSARLRKDADDTWRGEWLQPPFTPVHLAPRSAPRPPGPVEDPALELLLEDLRAAFEALSFTPETLDGFAGALAAIARVRPSAGPWLSALAEDVSVRPATRAMAERAGSLIGTPGHRHPAQGTVKPVGPTGLPGYV